MIYFLFLLFFKLTGTINVPEISHISKQEIFHKSAPLKIPRNFEIKTDAPALILHRQTRESNKNIPSGIMMISAKNLTESPPQIVPQKKIKKEIIINKSEELPLPVIKSNIKRIPLKIINKISRDSLKTPDKVKGIYLTGYSFSNEKRRTELFDLIKKTELNTVVIDIQDPYGNFMFPIQDKDLKKINISRVSFSREKFRGILAELQKNNIYTIARVTTFQDAGSVKAFPYLVLKNKAGRTWKNYNGISWLDMTNKDAWEIPRKKAQAAAEIGFDEIQFDYIRFPSDGIISQIAYKNLGRKRKYTVMEEFFAFLDKNKSKIGVPISIDLFGATYAKYSNQEYDLAIGQRLIGAVKYFDYLSPMIYPSHYPAGHMGYENPAKFPYAVVHKALYDGNEMIKNYTNEPISKSRPWLQAFSLGAQYNYKNIRAQIQAVDENNSSGWILWNARNIYSQAF